MKTLAPTEAQRYGSMNLPWRADEALLVSDPQELRAYLDGLSSEQRCQLQVAGELTNTVVGEHVPGRMVLFRDGDVADVRRQPDGSVVLEVEASCALDAVAAMSAELDRSGAELLSGIPGTVGAAVVQNAGAYGQALSDLFVRAVAYDRVSGDVVTLGPGDLQFGYRTSRLKVSPTFSPGLVLLTVSVALDASPPAPITYADLAEHHRSHGRPAADLEARRLSVLEVRDRKGMVVDGPSWRPSVGSYFVGPHVSSEVADRIATQVRGEAFARRLRDWYQPDRDVRRLPAALVLRAAGLMNGDRWGAVGLSDLHLLALCNMGGATGSEVAAVGRLVQREVHRELGIELEREVKHLGIPEHLDVDAYERSHPRRRGQGEPEWAEATGTSASGLEQHPAVRSSSPSEPPDPA